MKIDHLEVINLRFEYPGGVGFTVAAGTCTGRLTSLVFVHTDTGQVGIGSAYSHPALVYLIIKHQLEPMLRGEDPLAIADLWQRMYGLTRWYGRKGAAVSALGAIDMALWDLYGKACGKPVRTLLGESRDNCPAYASGLLWNEPEQLEEEAGRHLEVGFQRMKMRLGRSEAYDTAAVQTVRRTIGPDPDVMVDVSMRYHVNLARRIGRVLEANHVFWFEEPFAPEELDLYEALRGTVDVPIAAGENEFGTQGFDELIQRRAVDVVQPDACRCGGISEVWRVAKRANAAGLHVATHTWSDAVAILANAQVIAAIPNGLTVEVDQTGNPFIDHLLSEPLRVVDGQLQLSEAPGLGVELNPVVLNRYRVDDPLDVPDGHYADMVFGPRHAKSAAPYEELQP